MSEPDEQVLRAVDELAQKAPLGALDVVECHAIRFSPDAASGFTSNLDAGITPVDGGLVVRFTLTTKVVTGDGGPEVAEIKVGIGLAYTIADLPDPTGLVVGNFVARIAFKDAYPYLRQNTHELATRIGLVGVMLTTLIPPPTFGTLVPRQDASADDTRQDLGRDVV
ncbi:hypothetical protein KGA66_08570 [Actinocrinis puniceicyclus]|uniref:Preprotein translocase subunit SecB n=1 Tax=Actinocrinis puniceicyclus TaxID=977794 RepID=A0A8J7WLL4_9ACTN|nr:hypothetical protein [Actinocrinis puniceicyclus]MBS2963095.1 hypothetical protein [Actinocrinis puniceicyclus]